MSLNIQRPDPQRILKGLKDFQQSTVDYVFRRLYTEPDQTRRFLIADEVGLGKTMVAKGVIARAIDYLWDRVERIDVVYICSNADIARQNINRLNITNQVDFALASRITLLPKQIKSLNPKLNFVSFTPGTSFDLKSSMGRAEERVLLYWLLQRAWNIKSAGSLNVLQGGMGAARFREWVKYYDKTEIDETIAARFVSRLNQVDEQARRQKKLDLRQRFENLCKSYNRSDRSVDFETGRERSAWIGEVRALLASTCLQALEPDLIILDEFQRFKHLLDTEDEASQLAQHLFDYSDSHSSARVILLSATPYKMYTLSHDEAEDHYQDFLQTLRFLLKDPAKAAEMETLIAAYRQELLRMHSGDLTTFRSVKSDLEANLRRVMVRTERLAVSADRDGMLVEIPAAQLRLESRDLQNYLGLAQIADLVEQTSPLEFWKSTPYLLNFMDDYELKKEFKSALAEPAQHTALAKTLLAQQEFLLPVQEIARYAQIDPGNVRLRALMVDTIGTGLWRLLWVPPSFPYYQPNHPFSNPEPSPFTKRLVFSSWRVVPKAISVILSYEAERQMIKSFHKNADNTEEARKGRRPLLRFARSEGRLIGMPVLGLIYPCMTLAHECDPALLSVSLQSGTLPTLEVILKECERRIKVLMDRLSTSGDNSGPEDERWYWAAPLLLDAVYWPGATQQLFNQSDLAMQWAGREEDDDDSDTAWKDHVSQAQTMLAEFMENRLLLGKRPANLNRILAYLGIAGLGVVGWRAITRISNDTAERTHLALRTNAGKIAWSFLFLFNLPESMALIRGLNREEPYWQRVLEYCASGGLQAVMDEYIHVLRESLGLSDKSIDETAKEIADAVCDALTYKTSTPEIDDIRINAQTKKITIDKRSMRGRFALRFGDEKAEDSAEPTRADKIRGAFNSPFWPFVLATTSIGQEGLDFHPYCHAVVHWNLPANPVDLEQREGRVHRYKGHAVRKNLARQYTLNDVMRMKGAESDLWVTLFELGKTNRAPESTDLVPYWVYPLSNGAKIERHVLALPLSRDEAHLKDLRRSLTVYRMVFGQNRQEDLLDYLLTHLSREQLQHTVDEFRIDLSPFPATKSSKASIP